MGEDFAFFNWVAYRGYGHTINKPLCRACLDEWRQLQIDWENRCG